MNNEYSKKSPRTVAIIEARMGSSRLPGKVLAKINNTPAISILISRLKNCCEIDDVVVATSNSPLDDELAEYLKKTNTLFFRGSENDVLQRVVDTAGYFDAETIVEINGDCILTDFNVVDSAVQIFNKGNYDVVTNCGENLSYPMGIYAQVFSLKSLSYVAKNIFESEVREHVSLYFYDNPQTYKIFNMIAPKSISFPDWRLHLDYVEDLEFLNKLYPKLLNLYGKFFTVENIVEFLINNKELLKINQNCIENQPRK